MLTIFSMPKPFRGHIRVIQRNAVQSWARLHPGVEVILFGDEEGTDEVCREFRLRHEPRVERNEFNTPLLNYLFDRAQLIARYTHICYSNCDIILTSDFVAALARMKSWRDRFLMAGQRWDVDITDPLDFTRPDWESRVRMLVAQHGRQRPPEWIDYFAFSRGLCENMPPFAIGRPLWDDWLLWKVRVSGVPVVDASGAVVAIHQNHDYSHHPQGMKGVREGEEFKRNAALAGGWRHLYTLADASHVLEGEVIRRTYRHWRAQTGREIEHIWHPAWKMFLRVSRPVRHRIGLRQGAFARLFASRRDS